MMYKYLMHLIEKMSDNSYILNYIILGSIKILCILHINIHNEFLKYVYL